MAVDSSAPQTVHAEWPSEMDLSYRQNEQAGKFQHDPAVKTYRISEPDLIDVLGGKRLAHRRIKRREEWSQPRAFEPFDDACVVLDNVIVVGVPDVDIATQRTQQIIVVLWPRQVVARRLGLYDRGAPRARCCDLFHQRERGLVGVVRHLHGK